MSVDATAMERSATSLVKLVEHEWFKRSIISLIVINAILLGMETMRDLPEGIFTALFTVNRVILGVFVVELILRILAHRSAFFRDSWSLFDFAIVAAALMAPSGPFQVVRALRILRVLRLVSTVPSLRRVVNGLLDAVPGIGSVLVLLILILYIAGVMATMLFRDVAPDNFGHLGLSLFSLFQIMTLEGWAEIATDIMDEYTWAWMFFIGYILVATFLVLNLVIGVVVSSIQSRIEIEAAERSEDDSELKQELSAVRREIELLRESLERRD
jgi:voltage-gated sodium channel